MKVLVCGGRNFTDTYLVEQAMSQLPVKPTVVIHGEAKGADTLGKRWAMYNGIFAVGIPALWDAHGNRGAGPKRNQAMIDIMRPDYCVAFPGGGGTRDMIDRCKSAGIPTWEPYP